MRLHAVRQVAFTLPTVLPVSSSNLNWTPVTVGVAMSVVLGAWFFPKWGARTWYHGKAHTLEEETRVVSPLALAPPAHAPGCVFSNHQGVLPASDSALCRATLPSRCCRAFGVPAWDASLSMD